MYGDTPEDVFYYLTVYNEAYPQPAAPDLPRLRDGVLRGMYLLAAGGGGGPRAQILASGVSVPQALTAQGLLAQDWGIAADVWSVTSWNELRRDAVAAEEDALRHSATAAEPYVTTQLRGAAGPVVAVSDWMRAVPDQISRWVPGDYSSLGTDGFGRSDTRAALRRHFGVDAPSIIFRVLRSLVRRGEVEENALGAAARKYGLGD